MAAITDATESFEAEITHISEGSSIVFTLKVTDDASGFAYADDVTVVGVYVTPTSPTDLPPAVTAPDDVTEDPAGTFKFALVFPDVSKPATYTVTVAASGVTGLSADVSVTIVVLPNIEVEGTYGQILNFPIRISGNNVDEVNVEGLLQPLYHHWDATTGMLYIRSLGVLESLYRNLAFTVSARDADALVEVEGVVNVRQPAPAIRLPTEPLKFFFGRENEVDLQIDNRPSSVEVIGTWLGLSVSRRDTGVRFKGVLPEFGSESGKMIPGVNEGDFFVTARNSGNDPVYAAVPWVILHTKPQFRDVVFHGVAALNTAFTETILIDGDPEPNVVVESGALPTGLTLLTSFQDHVTIVSFTGMPTATGMFAFKLKATNEKGVTISLDYSIRVYTGLVAPSLRRRIPGVAVGNRWTRNVSRHFPLNMRRYFNHGTPEATYSFGTGTDTSLFAITERGVITVIGTPVTIADVRAFYDWVIVLTNAAGSLTTTVKVRTAP